MTGMYNDYNFKVEGVHPSGIPNYQSGHATATRKFKVEARKAEEFAIRQLGKFYTATSRYPVLPAPFPFDDSLGLSLRRGRLNLVATGFTIEPLSTCCFNNNGDSETGIEKTTDIDQMEVYFDTSEGPPAEEDPANPELDNTQCIATVTIFYEENICDCAIFNNTTEEWEVNDDLLPGTCLSVERNPSYEMYTLPNGNLVWEDLPTGTDAENAARRLKAETYAFKIIPKSDIIVWWHNVPVSRLCTIETHLAKFRGCVNDLAWGSVLQCDRLPDEGSVSCGCHEYEPETILFIDWQEDRSKRTDAFGGMSDSPEYNMNTTTLKLMFKQKRIEKDTTASYSDSDECPDENDIVYGWNHLFLDRETGLDEWMRVVVETTGQPIFPLKSFTNIMYPDL